MANRQQEEDEVVFEHGVDACGSIALAAVTVKLGSGVGVRGRGRGAGGVVAARSLVGTESAQQPICSGWGASPRQRIVMGQAGAHRADLR